jgi:hypothetical protein
VARLPSLKQELALIGGGAGKANMLCSHACSIRPFHKCSKSS